MKARERENDREERETENEERENKSNRIYITVFTKRAQVESEVHI